jgi:tRNA (guanosine-2'-O-)-methyltransferase
MGSASDKLIEYLSGYITPRRKQLFSEILANRTRYLTVVLEDIYQPQNASAVLRTCECFGLQDVHIIENRNSYTLNPDVVLGADKWLSIKKYRGKDFNTPEALQHLRKSGYRIVATTPGRESTNLEEFDLGSGRAAFFFGTEMTGLTETVMDQADEYLQIPILGFTRSFNISVSVAIIIHHLTRKLRGADIAWQLSEGERQEIMVEWLKKSVRFPDKHIREFRSYP